MAKTEKDNEAKKRPADPEKLAEFCFRLAEDKKAEDLVMLEMTDQTTIADYYVICAGTSAPHIKAIVNGVVRGVRGEMGKRPRAVEGEATSGWIVIDFNSVVIHVMAPNTRELYQLESLWGDAPKIDAVKKLDEKTVKN